MIVAFLILKYSALLMASIASSPHERQGFFALLILNSLLDLLFVSACIVWNQQQEHIRRLSRGVVKQRDPVVANPACAVKITRCTICHEHTAAGNGQRLPCGHIFHRTCIHAWFKHQRTCPMCRRRYDDTRALGHVPW